MRELACVEIVELATDYLERALDADARRAVDKHNCACWPCAWYFGEIATLVGLMSTMPAESPTPELECNLLTLYRGWAAEVRV
jgi:hypothetical protein